MPRTAKNIQPITAAQARKQLDAGRTPLALPADDLACGYQHLQVTPRMPGFAAWIDGLDLTRPINTAVKRELRRALWDFGVLFLRPQQISAEQHVALAGVFGKVSPGSFFERSTEHPDVEMIVNHRDRPPSIDQWHTDITWMQYPALGTVIQITETPPAGGNTCWVSTSKAFSALSPGMQAYLAQLSATHTWEVSGFRDALARHDEQALLQAMRLYKPVSHPVVLRHPQSGRDCLYVNSTFTKRINGLDHRESAGILRLLYDWLQRPDFMVHHQWERNGIAIWDNRSTQHYANADYWPHRRVNRRVTFEDPRSPQAGVNVFDQVMKGRPAG
jgi:taurine dioxygenase